MDDAGVVGVVACDDDINDARVQRMTGMSNTMNRRDDEQPTTYAAIPHIMAGYGGY